MVDIYGNWSTFESVQAEFRNKGFTPIPMPQQSCPVAIDGVLLSTAPNEELTEMGTLFLAWYNYCSEQLSLTESYLLEVENISTQVEMQVKARLRGSNEYRKKPLGVDALKDAVLESVEYIETLREVQRWKQTRKLLDARLAMLDRGIKMVSRQVAIRGLDVEAMKMELAANRGSGPR